MKNILITGANRGIGFELARQFAQQGGTHVFATCRTPSRADELQALATQHPTSLTVLQLDITDEASIDAAVNEVTAVAGTLDVLINNAGISPRAREHQSRDLGQLSLAHVTEVISTNAVAPLIVTQSFRGLLSAAVNPRVVMISSGLGLLQRAGGGSYAYRISKAAMNMAARSLALDAAMEGIITIALNPGWVQTDMGGEHAAITPAHSVRGMLALIGRLSQEDNGKIFQYDGAEPPW